MTPPIITEISAPTGPWVWITTEEDRHRVRRSAVTAISDTFTGDDSAVVTLWVGSATLTMHGTADQVTELAAALMRWDALS